MFYYVMVDDDRFLSIAEYVAPQGLMLASSLVTAIALAVIGTSTAREETATSTALYLDMLKRVLVNVVYHEQSHTVSLTRSIAEGRPDPVRADPAAFSLKDRALGEDVALNALSMVGLKRLDNIEACVTAIVKEGVALSLIHI